MNQNKMGVLCEIRDIFYYTCHDNRMDFNRNQPFNMAFKLTALDLTPEFQSSSAINNYYYFKKIFFCILLWINCLEIKKEGAYFMLRIFIYLLYSLCFLLGDNQIRTFIF